ncbi:non-ribosomal peptide synthase/polyketide synthase [Azotobacter vinelandii]|uniref:non-ribosomal peptide synthase/polyketide synthase n=1 Tax=Azotobacter vinelandii TaxID=354 RepID=UPI002665A116|nr:non-ribosomal peptide synthase/polyketide synthase [Azotobacter vinelandii]WKN24386.1 non-ribosomal peptide synthase/polyketide synthase [Azotobacter vinelandii]
MTDTFERPVSMADALMRRAAAQPERLALRFLGGDGEEVLSYRQLDRQARIIAAALAERGEPGERAVLLFPSGPDYVAAFFACLYAGVIAVPAYPPESSQEQHLRRLISIIADAQPRLILTTSGVAGSLAALGEGRGDALPELLAVDALDPALADGWRAPAVPAEAIAFLQYTSGSTATPKGVQVSHANLEANEWLIRQGYRIGDDDTIVSWLPLYHDMGLIGGLLQGIYSGVPVVLMSPQHFLERPVRWLEAIGRYRGTISGGPDFAYRLCHERIAEGKLAGLDLSGWRVAFSGSEPIRQDSLAAFAERFAPCGFRPDAYLASYGLAEATLFVSGGRPGQGIPALRLDAAALAADRAEPGEGPVLMSCGWEQPGHPLLIVDPRSGEALGDGLVGEIWSSGPSVAQGYWRNPQATAQVFVERDGRTWLRTGDLGFRQRGELFVTGRLKDMLIVRGQNLYPQDIERTVEECVAEVRRGRVAAFAVEHEGREALGVAAEIGRRTAQQVAADELLGRIRQAVAEAHHEAPVLVLLLEPGALPKTSSGKLQRSACRQRHEAGELVPIASFREGRGAEPAADATPPGERLAALWRTLLKAERLDSDAHFFALGGNSIQAIQMIAELRDELGVDLELRSLYEAPTLRAFGAELERLLAEGGASATGIPRLPREGALRQSAAQNRLWFLWQLEPHSVAYNIPGGLRLRGELDEQALRHSFATLVERHESLRTTFYEEDGIGFQRAGTASDWTLLRDDLSALPEAQREERARTIREEEARFHFDLEHGPLLRVRLVSLDEQEHLLLVTLHHIVADGWSLGLLLDEFARLYAARVQGQTASLAPLPIRYADYAAWQADDGERLAAQLDYWRAELADEHQPLALPLDRPRGGRESSAERFGLRLDKALGERLQALARARGTTLFAVLLAAFQTLLHRYTGQADIRLGVPNANRPRRELQGLVGFFINTQVLRGRLDSRQTFAALLEAARRTVEGAQANQDLPYERLVEALGGEPPFEVMFNHQQRDLEALRRLPGLLAEELPWHSREAKFDLQLHSEEDRQGRIRLSFDYACELFERASVERLAGHFVRLLEQIGENPERAIGDFELLGVDERQRLRDWARGPAEPAGILLPELLSAQARATPQAIALVSGEATLDYADLERRANRLAHRLRELGVGPEVKVGLLAGRGIELMVALLAVVKAGGAYVPMDADYPRERLAWMIGDSGLRLLLGHRRVLEALEPPPDLATLALEELDAGDCPDTPPALALDAGNLAYVIYTSGSTGQPKGVGVSHGALSERLHWMRREYALDASDVLLQKAPLGFDVSVWECFLPLIAGSRLVLAADGEHRDPRRLVELARAHGVTCLHFVPPLLQLFVEEPALGDCRRLRLLFSGGEALSGELCRRVRERLPQVALHNRYGPTETAINVTHWRCAEEGARVPIGRPLANVVCELRDAELELAPGGAVAELLLGGSGLARGYLGRPALTAERFVPGEDGARLYRSGDLARWRDDGALEFLGRADEQVKVRGFRIEPEEIRAHLLSQPAVRQAVVLVREGAAGARLVAYLTSDSAEDDPALAERLKRALAASLPEYMVPAQFVRLDALPLTPTGKLDRKALPEPDWRAGEYVAPRDERERRLAAIWQEVLGLPRVGLDDDFFALGGHSLLATRIASRVRQAFDLDLPLRSLFEASRLGEFAAEVARLQAEGARDGWGAIERADRSRRIPLSHSQQRMWFLWQLDPQSPAYNVGGMARLSGPLDAQRFEMALQALIRRHETLRTTFPSDDGKPWQQVAERSDLCMQRLDLSALPADQRRACLQELADEQAHQPFDLECGPLLRVCLVKAGEHEHYLVVTLHHIVTEGWAMDVFARELGALYEAFLDGRESPLEALPVQYLDYSQWQRRWLEGGERQRQLDYWKRQLGDEHPLLELPADRPRPPVQSHRGELFRFDLEPALAGRVRAWNAAHGLTMFMTATAALALLLYRYSGQGDLRIGAPVANRIRPESEGLIGAFLNTQVLRCRLDGRMSVDELLEQVRDTVIEGQAHQDLPFDELVEALQPPRSATHHPLFQVMCNVQRWEFQQTRQLAGMTVEYLVNDARATKFDLYLEVTDLDQRLGCCLTYSSDLFDEPRIARMAGHWTRLLEAMVELPSRRLAELPMLAEAEATRLAEAPGDYPLDACLHELFETQAARTPEAPALTFAGRTLSYAELDARANRLARVLRERGVGPEVPVGLALERSAEMVVGILAILKAGGAYVPLDPEYPLERLRYLIEDSGIALLLGHAVLFEALGELPAGVARWCLEDDLAALDGQSGAPLPRLAGPDNLAYLIYTSGSTGQPKGVAVCHGEIAMHCRAVIERFGMAASDCELHFYSINFDAATERLFAPLLCGARLVLRGQGQWDAESICQLIREQSVSILGFTPSYGSQLAQWLISRDERLPVRLCITGGEALSGEHLQRIRAAFAPQAFFNAYGPTETVVMPLACRAPETLEEGAASVPIGSLVGARRGAILDADLAPLPQGAAGELYLGGKGLARGYHRRPALSAERFVPDADGARLYRSGDRVRLRDDGQVEYLGRIDQQVKVRGFRIELGEIEARLREHPAVTDTAVLALDTSSGKQLAGYVATATAGLDEAARAALREALKAHLRAQLPDYMVPAHLSLLEKLPLTPNGKLDRRALPAPDPEQDRQAYQAPRSELERQLATIWTEALNVGRIGLGDNFFELGGDSILSIQVVSRARQAGIHFTPRDLFQHQTVQALATVARSVATVASEQGPLSGATPLTPIQHWFFEQHLAKPQHWNQSLLLEPSGRLDADCLEKALHYLRDHHDALRLAFRQIDGHWRAEYRAVGEGGGELLWRVRPAGPEERRALFAEAQRSLDLAHGPLLRAVLAEDASGRQTLLLAIHHLAVDGVSWRVLLEDLQSLYRQFEAGRSPALPARTSSLRDWATRLEAYAASESLREELVWWRTHLAGTDGELPCDRAGTDDRYRDARSLSLRLDTTRTRQLLQQAPAAYRSRVDELLLTALARVLCRWSGRDAALVQLEGHGREALFDDIDLTRTLGWFTSAYPVRLQPAGELADAIKAVKEQLRGVPHKGLGHGVLRHLADADTRAAMAALPQARITFNYLGQFDQSFAHDALFRPLDEPAGPAHAEDAPLPNRLSIDAQVYGGELRLRWTYGAGRYDEGSVRALAEELLAELQRLIEHCLEEESGGPTPSDFPLAQLTQAQLDTLPVPAAAIEDIYPLTPMQEGLLLHTLLEPGTGIYYMQDRYRIDSELDLQRFEQAWQAVVARHEALRASFTWNSGETMLQIVHKPGAARIDYLDWSALDADGHEERLQALHKRERETGFDLLREPPFHLRLIRLGEARYWFMMSNHHILIDAWCRGLLMGDFMEIYAALGEGREPRLPSAPRYRDYIAWLQRQDFEAARHWWRDNLRGFERPTAIPGDRPLLREHTGGMQVGDCLTRLEAADGARLRELAQRHQLTVNTFAQAAWALVLHRYSGERDLTFGVTVAGRPVSMPALQGTVGLFINSIPLRLRLPAPGERRAVRDWLRELLERNLELREYEYLSLVDIQECSELPKGQPLFDSLFVFENAPVDSAVLDRAQGLNARSESGRTHTNFPLTVVCYPGDDLGLHLSYDRRYFEAATIERLLGDFKRLLLALADGILGDLSDLPLLDHGEREFLTEGCNRSERDYPLEQGYVRLFEARVAAHPERIVARCQDAQWNYAGLNARANRLGHALRAAGVGVDQPVALLAERGLDLLGMMIGAFKAGAGYLPLDPGHPAQRLTRILELGRVPLLVCSAECRAQAVELLEALAGQGRPRLLVWDEVQAGDWPTANPGVYSGPDSLAYVIYTSGSTGLPKGVMVEQAGMLNNQLSKVPYLGLDEADAIAQTASQSFDISVWQFLAAPLFGGRVEIVPNAIAHDPGALLALARERGVTVLESVPSLIQGMLAEERDGLGALRWLLPTGEAMPPELARQWLQRYPQVGLVNAYGPAECSDDVALFRVDMEATAGSYLPIGSPTDNNRLYLLDESLELVPAGATGELCIAGTGVGRGYVGDPLRTALAFLPNPFAREPGERLYRSGDLARRRVDGLLEYVGRIDHQVKIRGFRIELGEIEAHLHEQAEVREAAVAVQEGPNGKYLVGYLVPADMELAEVSPATAPLLHGELFERVKQRLRAELPDYMVPAHWLLLEGLPRNTNGKLDRKALPELEIGQSRGQAYLAPRNDLERTLATIWAELLKVERVGVHDNFFELGGHSLLATQIASRVQKALQRNVPLRAMFECSTVGELAAYIESLEGSALTEQKASRLDDLMSRLEAL